MLDKILNFITHKIKEIQNKIQTLTTKVGTLEKDTGWKKLTLSSNWEGSNNYCDYRKKGDIVDIRLYVINKYDLDCVSNSALVAYGMPAEIIPREHSVRTVAYSKGKPYLIYTSYKGSSSHENEIRIQGAENMTKGYSIFCQFSYIVGG